jgi:hypothetical protein
MVGKREHKSKAEKKRLAKQRKVKVVGEGRFVQRAKRPAKQGKNVKSQLLRVDGGFADWCRKKAETDGSVTVVTRKLHHQLKQAELDAAGIAMDRAVKS